MPLVDGARESRLERVLGQLPHGIVVVDRELIVDYVNEAARRLLGGDGSLRQGAPLPEGVGDVSVRALARPLFGYGLPSTRTLATVRDRILSIEAVSAPGAEAALMIVEDVTEQERLRQGERRFVENAAHELRTPVAAIVSVIDVLEGGAKDEPDTRDRFLLHLRAQSDRLSRLATSLLALARIQSGQQAPRIELVRVRPLLDRIAGDLQPRRGVTIKVTASDEIAALSDPELLQAALYNVAANSVKNTLEGEIVVAARTAGDLTELEIRDTGAGMSRDDRDRAYDRFYRAGRRDDEGFGLGLAIAKDAVEAVGGSIELESELGRGTCVRIVVPAATNAS